MGFNIILGKGIVYSILAGSVTALYFGFLYLVARLFQGISGNYSLLIGLFFFFLFSVAFEPLRDRLQEWVDKTFFKSRFDYEKTLKETSTAMSLLTDRDRLLKLTARLITRRMKLQGVAMFILDEKHDRFEVKGSEGAFKNLSGHTMSSNYALIEYLEETKLPLMRSEIENKVLDVFISEEERKKMEGVLADLTKQDMFLCVPSIMKNKLVAFIALGNKLSSDMFNKDDLNFLSTLANQSSIFLENTKLLEREKESAKIMAEASTREKYTAMLENVNKQLVETREQLVKAERLTTVTKMTISLQHEINNPLTSVLVQTQALLLKMQQGTNMPPDYVKERLTTVEREARRIRELLRNLANITEPVSLEYVPGEEMIDIKASSHDITPEDTEISP
jgi:K+-sensing histidine kinase KdpD